ncbi:hypothetical protein QBC43DRAFT_370635 [Cladorrhinum sp. PSN259]|nr:hypothetical protein QBC43DRAFT_370635 [Cladorrhinum sp. PSN259]
MFFVGSFIGLGVLALAVSWLLTGAKESSFGRVVEYLASIVRFCLWFVQLFLSLVPRVILGVFLRLTVSPALEKEVDSILEFSARRMAVTDGIAYWSRVQDQTRTRINGLQCRLREIGLSWKRDIEQCAVQDKIGYLQVPQFSSRMVTAEPEMGKIVGFLLWLNRVTRSSTCLEAVMLSATYSGLQAATKHNDMALAECLALLASKEAEYHFALVRAQEEHKTLQPQRWPLGSRHVRPEIPLPAPREPDVVEYPLHREQRLLRERQALHCPQQPAVMGFGHVPAPLACQELAVIPFAVDVEMPTEPSAEQLIGMRYGDGEMECATGPQGSSNCAVVSAAVPVAASPVFSSAAATIAAPAPDPVHQFGAVVPLPVSVPAPFVAAAQAPAQLGEIAAPVAPAAQTFSFGGDSVTGSGPAAAFFGGSQPQMPAFPSAPAPANPPAVPTLSFGPSTVPGNGKEKATEVAFAPSVSVPAVPPPILFGGGPGVDLSVPAASFLAPPSRPSAAPGSRFKPKPGPARKRPAVKTSIEVGESSKTVYTASRFAVADPDEAPREEADSGEARQGKRRMGKDREVANMPTNAPYSSPAAPAQGSSDSSSSSSAISKGWVTKEELNTLLRQVINTMGNKIWTNTVFTTEFRNSNYAKRCHLFLEAAIGAEDRDAFKLVHAALFARDDVFAPVFNGASSDGYVGDEDEYFKLVSQSLSAHGLVLPSQG